MEKILVLLLFIILITGCSWSSDTAGSVVKESVCNSPYFEFKTGECCLDQNSNKICDKDETATPAVPAVAEPAPVETPVAEPVEEEIKIILEDSCSETTYFECLASYITDKEVFFKLRTKRDGFTHLKKISVLGCEKTFVDKEKSSQGYTIRSDVLVSLPCLKLTAGDEIKDADYTIEYIYYPQIGIDSDTGEWGGKPRALQISTGKISGTVRNEPKKIV